MLLGTVTRTGPAHERGTLTSIQMEVLKVFYCSRFEYGSPSLVARFTFSDLLQKHFELKIRGKIFVGLPPARIESRTVQLTSNVRSVSSVLSSRSLALLQATTELIVRSLNTGSQHHLRCRWPVLTFVKFTPTIYTRHYIAMHQWHTAFYGDMPLKDCRPHAIREGRQH